MRYPFQRHQRLLKPDEFKAVFAAAHKSSDRYLTILARPNSLTHPRLGLAIARKRVRHATARNRIKRLIRDSFRLHQYQLPPIDCVVMAKEEAAHTCNRTLLAALATHWQRLTRQCKPS